MMNKQQKIRAQLFIIQQHLEVLNIWQSFSPTPEKLDSQQPFAVDTLLPEEWLQWILIPRMHAILDHFDRHLVIPKPFSIASYFEEAWKDQPYSALIIAIQELDQLVNNDDKNDNEYG